MQYTLSIDQKFCISHDLRWNEAFVYSWLLRLPSWAKGIDYEGTSYFFASRNKACTELPFVSDKPDTFYRIYKRLEERDLVYFEKFDGRDMVAINPFHSQRWNSRTVIRESDSHPRNLGQPSENNSDSHPTYKSTSSYNNTNDKESDFFENENPENPNSIKTDSKKEKKKLRQKEKKEGMFDGDQRSLIVKMNDAAKERGFVSTIKGQSKYHAQGLVNKIREQIQERKKNEGYTEWAVKDHEVLEIFIFSIENAKEFWTEQFSFKKWDDHFESVMNSIKSKPKNKKAQFMQELYDDLQNREYDF